MCGHEGERRAEPVACTLAPWDRDVNGMHRRQQVRHAPIVTRQATGSGSATEAPYGASWPTGAGGPDDTPATSALPTRAVKRRTGAGRPLRGQTSGARTGAAAAGR